MAYNKAKEEYKWKVWKEQEEKKLRELGVSEEVIAELRDYDWNCFKQERNYKNHQMPDTDFIERTEDASGKWEIQQPVNVQDFIKSLDDNKLRKELQKLDQVTLYIILLKTFGYGTEEIGKLLGMKANTVSARMKLVVEIAQGMEGKNTAGLSGYRIVWRYWIFL